MYSSNAAPVTAVWALPGRAQINVCRPCLDEMVRRGEWQVEGARLRRRADVAVFDTSGKLQLVIEAKYVKSHEDSVKRSIQIRHNLLAHSGLPQAPFFLIAFPDYFFLWDQTLAESFDRPADYQIDAQDIIKPSTNRQNTNVENLSPSEFEGLVAEWRGELVNAEDMSRVPEWMTSSGLYQAIKDGSAVQEVAV